MNNLTGETVQSGIGTKSVAVGIAKKWSEGYYKGISGSIMKRNPLPGSKIYVGELIGNYGYKIFQSIVIPSARTHGRRYLHIFGPFSTLDKAKAYKLGMAKHNILKKNNPKRELSVFDKHQIKIAKSTLNMSDVGAMIMGGMTKQEARDILRKFGIRFNESYTRRNPGIKSLKVNPKLRKIVKKSPYSKQFILKERRVDRAIKKMLGKDRKNPPRSGSKVIYDKIISIEAQKGKSSLWPKELFRHDFKKDKTAAKIIGNPDGSLTIKSTKGKRLWKEFDYDEKERK